MSLCIQWQSTGKGQSRPTLEPVVHILRGDAPQGMQQADQQEALLTSGTQSPARARWQWVEDNDDGPYEPLYDTPGVDAT